VPTFTPVDGVGVLATPAFKAGPTAKLAVEGNPDLTVRVRRVAPAGGKGTVLRLEYHNGGSDPVDSFDFPTTTNVVLIDPRTMTSSGVRKSDGTDVVSGSPNGDLNGRDSYTRDLLMAPLPASVHQVIVTGPRMRRSFPVTVGSEAVQPRVDIPAALDAPTTRELVQKSNRFHRDAVPVSRPVDIDAAQVGPELPMRPRLRSITSAAQPGWTVAPREVVRVSDKDAFLVLDLTRGNTDDTWPEGVGNRGYNDLSAIGLIDTTTHRRLGVLTAGSKPLASDGDDSINRGETRTVYAAFPAPARAARTLTVDVPSFGQVAGVPVVAGTRPAPAGASVVATMRASFDPRLRMDVLRIGRMPGGNGTLVRTRMVNESNPDAVNAPWGLTGINDLCRLALVDPDNNERYYALDPCAATDWQRDLGAGDSLAYEVRFPTLPDRVHRLVVDADGFVPSVPVSVAVGAKATPWYLDLPAAADAPSGDTLTGSVGVADDLQSEIRTGDSVEVNLNTDVLFAFGSATLNPTEVGRLVGIAGRLAKDASGTVTVTGYTDSVGDDASNLALSQRRAEAVRGALGAVVAKAGLSMAVDAKGEADPVAPNDIGGRDNPDGRARNRRVTITYTAA
jgi:outer membrane protein OmpA-like peptidoglycan-associated protein